MSVIDTPAIGMSRLCGNLYQVYDGANWITWTKTKPTTLGQLIYEFIHATNPSEQTPEAAYERAMKGIQ